jgi:hypothetical protein
MRLVGELNRDQFVERALSKQGVIVALFLAQPPDALHVTFANILTGK